MVEPFSLSSGAVGIIAMGLAVCNGITQYYNSYKRAPASVKAIETHVANLTRVLNLLRFVIRSSQHQYPRNTRDQVEEYISSCDSGVKELERKLMKCKATQADDKNGLINVKNAGKRLIYPFRESTLAKIREIVSELMDPLSLALDALQITQNSLLAAEINNIKGGVDSISENIKKIQYGNFSSLLVSNS